MEMEMETEMEMEMEIVEALVSVGVGVSVGVSVGVMVKSKVRGWSIGPACGRCGVGGARTEDDSKYLEFYLRIKTPSEPSKEHTVL